MRRSGRLHGHRMMNEWWRLEALHVTQDFYDNEIVDSVIKTPGGNKQQGGPFSASLKTVNKWNFFICNSCYFANPTFSPLSVPLCRYYFASHRLPGRLTWGDRGYGDVFCTQNSVVVDAVCVIPPRLQRTAVRMLYMMKGSHVASSSSLYSGSLKSLQFEYKISLWYWSIYFS